MAPNKKHIYSEGLNEHDLEYAQMLLDWSKSLNEVKYVSLEVYEVLWRRERERERERLQ